MLHTIDVRTTGRCQLLDVTDRIQTAVRASGAEDGVAVCFVPHTTAGITIQENADPSVVSDVLARLEALAPPNLPEYRHMEGNSDSHVKTSLVGPSEQVIIVSGKLLLGTWQSIYFAEFDGPRNRKLHVKIISG